MTNYMEHASESTVTDFIFVAKHVAGVNLTPRDEFMLKSILTAEKVTNGGIEIVFTPRKVAMARRDFEAHYIRR